MLLISHGENIAAAYSAYTSCFIPLHERLHRRGWTKSRYRCRSGSVRDGLGAKLGLGEWTGNDVNDKVRQAKVEGSGLEPLVISVARKITLLILTYDLALESKDRLQQRGRAEGLLYVLI